MKKLFYLLSFIFYMLSAVFSQSSLNPSSIRNHQSKIINLFNISFTQSLYLNTNLPNLENQNGNYFPKGYGVFSSLLLQYRSSHFTLTAEPMILDRRHYEISIPKKENEFSVLNDVPLLNIYNQSRFRNTGFNS